MTPSDYEHILQRVALAEQEIAAARVRSVIASLMSLAAMIATVGALSWSPTVHADATATFRAPFVVVDAANKPIMTVQDGTAAKIKSVKTGEEHEVATSNRGLTVFNAMGDAVARVAVTDGHGYIVARQAGSGSGLGGPGASLIADQEGTHLTILGADKKSVRLGSDYGGLTFESDGTILTELNRTHLLLNSAAGLGLVEAGETKDGRGRVTVGPRFGGPQGGGAITFPYMILGRK